MTNTELVSYFNLSDKIDYAELSKKISMFLASDEPNRVSTVIELMEVVTELDWNMYQYNEVLHSKTYSELYSMIVSTYALNSKLGKIPADLTQLDIKLRRESDTEKIISIIDMTFIPMMLNLLQKFTMNRELLKIIDVILVTRKVCIKYHKKVKLTLEEDRFKRIKIKYSKELAYFEFSGPFTEVELKRRYRAKAIKTHPDRGGDAKEFIKCKEYYEELSKLF